MTIFYHFVCAAVPFASLVAMVTRSFSAEQPKNSSDICMLPTERIKNTEDNFDRIFLKTRVQSYLSKIVLIMHTHRLNCTQLCQPFTSRTTSANKLLHSNKQIADPRALYTFARLAILLPSGLTYDQLLVQKNFKAKIIGRRIFRSILLYYSTFVIINNTIERNCRPFPIEKRSGNIIYWNKTLKNVFSDGSFFEQH